MVDSNEIDPTVLGIVKSNMRSENSHTEVNDETAIEFLNQMVQGLEADQLIINDDGAVEMHTAGYMSETSLAAANGIINDISNIRSKQQPFELHIRLESSHISLAEEDSQEKFLEELNNKARNKSWMQNENNTSLRNASKKPLQTPGQGGYRGK